MVFNYKKVPRFPGALLLEKKEDGARQRPALRIALRKEKA